MTDMKAMAKRAIACLDLTNLNDDCTEEDVAVLCNRARTDHGTTAAICIWPRFVAFAKRRLSPDVKLATVVAFPTGNDSAEDVIAMTEQAVRDGADEIDMVIPYRSLMEGRPEKVSARVERVRRAAGGKQVKAILETGLLAEPELIRRAAELALAGGADFLKTSTGKVPINATLGAAEIMLKAIRDSGSPAGFKAAGGIRSTADAAAYLELADEIMGEGWAAPARFRFGASGVLDALIETLEGREGGDRPGGY